ncbi:TonB family protein [Microbulbifer bruguierae]|uniref:TonB family protein n=1 Tax=Microbulbifer bruguierae TaxID=3029061 RepID=A0ABY8NAD7_9GAMM|nr:TonB family protein [Microbulbifer bruguierae]WGL15861.1 TonB family protein [Microbulbifer bruguierae]
MFVVRPRSGCFAILAALSLSLGSLCSQVQAADLATLFQAYQAAMAEGDASAVKEKAAAVYEYAQQNLPQDSKSRAAAELNFGKALFASKDYQRAEQVLEEALNTYQQAYGEKAQELVDPYLELAKAVAGNQRASWAHQRTYKKYIRKALRIVADTQGKDSLLYAIVSLEAGRVSLDLAKAPEARGYLEDAHAAFSGPHSKYQLQRFYANFYLGKYHMAKKQHSSAREYLEAALEIADQKGVPDGTLEMTTRAFLVDIYDSLGEEEKSIAQCRTIGSMVPFDMDQEPKPLFRRMPEYPEAALNNGQEGFAVVNFTISDSGIPRDIKAIETEGSKSFGFAAEEYVKRLRYAPRFEGGEPVDTPDRKVKVKFSMGK